jgi:hypothetical protein
MRIAVIANKNWEVEPLLHALSLRKIFPSFDYPIKENTPTSQNVKISTCRRHFKADRHDVTVHCIQDYIGDDKYESSSRYKYDTALPQLFDGLNADLYIAFGTAGFPRSAQVNGCVAVGSSFYVYNAKRDNPDSDLDFGSEGKLLVDTNGIIRPHLQLIEREKNNIASLFLLPPENPCPRPKVFSDKANIALSVINITNYADYVWADRAGLDKFAGERFAKDYKMSSIETTHGLIRLYANKPVMWVSAITDREGYFDLEVTPLQNDICSVNAGILVGKFLESIPIP